MSAKHHPLIVVVLVIVALTDQEMTSALGREHRIKEFVFDSPHCGPSIIQTAPNGDIWVAMAKAGRLGRFRGEQLREFPLPDGALPVGIVVDVAGSVWYSDIRRNCIGQLDPHRAAVREFGVPTANAWPFFLVQDSKGRLWFTERVGNKLGRLDPRTAEVVEYEVPTPNAQPAGLAITTEDQLFFTENSTNRIGAFDPDIGVMVEYDIPSRATPSPFYGPAGIVCDRSGNVWFCELDGRLGLIRARTREIVEFAVPWKGARPAGIVVDHWGVVWFTQLDANSIASFYPELGIFREYPIPSGQPDDGPKGPPEATARGELPGPGFGARTSRPFGITCDDSGRIWFSEQYAHRVGMLTPPSVDIIRPTGVVRELACDIVLNYRVSHDACRASYTLTSDGIGESTTVTVPGVESLDCTYVLPGKHRLSVEVECSTGVVKGYTEFVFEPTLHAICQMALEFDRQRASGFEQKDIVIALDLACRKTEVGRTDVAREIIKSLLWQLDRAGGVPSREVQLLVTHLRYFDLFSNRHYNVTIDMQQVPAREVFSEVGDTLLFHNVGREPVAVNSSDPLLDTQVVAATSTLQYICHEEGTVQLTWRQGESESVTTVRIGPRTALIREFPMLGPGRIPTVLDIDQEGRVWFTAGGGGFSTLGPVGLNNRIGCLGRDGTIREFETPTKESAPTSLKIDSRNRIWFTERGANAIACFDCVTGRMREYPVPTENSAPTGISLDEPRGRVWFTEKHAGKFGYLDAHSGTVVEFNTISPSSEPSTISVDDNGSVWFDERGSDNLVSFNPDTFVTRRIRVPTRDSRVIGITPTRDAVWFLELAGHKVGKLDVHSGTIVEYTIPTAAATPFKLTIDGLGRVWFTEVFGNKIGVLSPNGRFYEFALPTKDAMPGGITIDKQGNVWFALQSVNRLGMIPAAALCPCID